MIPISDERVPEARFPIVTISLIAVNTFVYFFLQPSAGQATSLQTLPVAVSSFYDRWALVPAEIVAGQDLHSLLSSLFLHGGAFHLASNMLYLWIFGDNVEHVLGRSRFLLFYLLCGLLASGTQILVFPDMGIWNLGASGSIAGVLGAYLVLYPHSVVRVVIIFFWFHITRVRASFMIILWFVLELWSGSGLLAAEASAQEGGVAYWAHIGGFVAGFFLIWLAKARPLHAIARKLAELGRRR